MQQAAVELTIRITSRCGGANQFTGALEILQDDLAVEEHQAEAVLRQSNWVDPAQRRAAYAEQGWTRFDETLDPYGPAEIERERLRYRR